MSTKMTFIHTDPVDIVLAKIAAKQISGLKIILETPGCLKFECKDLDTKIEYFDEYRTQVAISERDLLSGNRGDSDSGSSGGIPVTDLVHPSNIE